MFFLITITLIVGLLIYYVLSLNFEAGDGFTEMKKKIREAEYRIVDKKKKDIDTENKLLK